MIRNTTLALALLAATPFAALAQTPGARLDPVDVRGSKSAPRADVSSACPSYASALKARLETQLPEIAQARQLVVHFQLDGQVIRRVSTPRMPLEYRRFVRSAVRSMSCSADAKPHQHYAFVLALLPEGHGEQRLAVSEASDTLLAGLER